MNDPILLAKRLRELLLLAKDASNRYEEAAVYAATNSILEEFNKDKEKLGMYTLEKVLNACWHINAIVGYDVTNDKDNTLHASWALGELDTLDCLLEEWLERRRAG